MVTLTHEEIRELAASLISEIAQSKIIGEPQDSTSWSYQEGILISRREAEFLLELMRITLPQLNEDAQD